MRVHVAFLVVALQAVASRPAAAGVTDRGRMRVILSDRTTLAAKEEAARNLGSPTLSKQLVSVIRKAPQQGFIGILMPLEIARTIGRSAGPEAIPSLISRLRNRSAYHFRWEQRGRAEVVAALEIADRQGRLREVEDRIVTVLIARQAARPQDGELAKQIMWTLGGSRTDFREKKPVLNSKAVRKFLYGLLDHPDPDVRKTAARSLSDRDDPALILRALRGVGIRPAHRASVRRELVDFTIFVDDALKKDPRIQAQLRRYQKSARSPELREAAGKVVSAIELDERLAERLEEGPIEISEETKRMLREIWDSVK